jgi:Flp pilus assembly protein TadG
MPNGICQFALAVFDIGFLLGNASARYHAMNHLLCRWRDRWGAQLRTLRQAALLRQPAESRRGAAVVELAVLLPLLAFLFIISVDFARVYYYSITVTNCARAGAMYASDPTTAGESPYANVTAAALSDATNLSPAPTVTSTTGTDSSGRGYAEVTVKYTFNTITGFPGVPNQVELVRTVRMNISASVPKS